ncbi:MAG: response regulator transcription factor [Marinifilaceae bacterium]
MEYQYRILYVEDDAEAAQDIILIMKLKANIMVDWVTNGDEMLEQLKNNTYELILLDMELPNQSGLQLLPLLRKTIGQIPIILYSSHNDYQIVNNALDAGADDYICKGDDMEVMIVKLLRHINKNSKTGELLRLSASTHFNSLTRELTHESEQLSLSPMEAKLLVILFNNKNKIIPNVKLENQLFGYVKNENGHHDLRRYITSLRKYIVMDKYLSIKNTYRVGYGLFDI